LATAIQLQEVARRPWREYRAFDLLCQCCRLSHAVPANGRIDEFQDWDALLRLASHHRVLPAVYLALKGRGDIPGSILSALDARFSRHVQRALRFSALLMEVSGQLQKCGVTFLCHKGPALAQTLYGDVAMREFGDLDFLVRAKDVQQAGAAMAEIGLTNKLALSPRQGREYLRTGYEYVFGTAREPNLVEIQWQLLPRFYSADLELEEFFQRSVELSLEGADLRTPCDEDHLLLLCVHAAKHGWSQLGMVRDISTLADRGLDWNFILHEASRLGLKRILDISLKLGERLLGLKVPGEISAELKDRQNGVRVSEICHRMLRSEEIDSNSLRYVRMTMGLRERRRDQIRIAWRLATTPGIGEWQSRQIPDSLFLLYRAVRTWRLGTRALRGIRSNAKASPTK
jgi:hypothetical protein